MIGREPADSHCPFNKSRNCWSPRDRHTRKWEKCGAAAPIHQEGQPATNDGAHFVEHSSYEAVANVVGELLGDATCCNVQRTEHSRPSNRQLPIKLRP